MDETGKQVYVVGSRRTQNELISSYVASSTGVGCTFFASLSDLSAGAAEPPSHRALILKDYPPVETSAIRDQLHGFLGEWLTRRPPPIVAMFNVPTGKGIETEIYPCGVKGFFYEADGPATILKGISALFEGELWMSRRVMTECLLAPGRGQSVAIDGEEPLTTREIEVLAKIAGGLSNEQISDNFCISPHTVKTHVYRIFRKIGATNRLQAALWAAKHL